MIGCFLCEIAAADGVVVEAEQGPVLDVPVVRDGAGAGEKGIHLLNMNVADICGSA